MLIAYDSDCLGSLLLVVSSLLKLRLPLYLQQFRVRVYVLLYVIVLFVQCCFMFSMFSNRHVTGSESGSSVKTKIGINGGFVIFSVLLALRLVFRNFILSSYMKYASNYIYLVTGNLNIVANIALSRVHIGICCWLYTICRVRTYRETGFEDCNFQGWYWGCGCQWSFHWCKIHG